MCEQYQGIEGVLFLRPLFCEKFSHFDGCISLQTFVCVPLLCIGSSFICGVKEGIVEILTSTPVRCAILHPSAGMKINSKLRRS